MNKERVSQVAREMRRLQEQQAGMAYDMTLALFRDLGVKEGSVYEKERLQSAIEDYMR